MNPQLTLVVYCLGYFAVFASLGSGPALALGRSAFPISPILLAPCLGVALAGAGLVSIWPFMTMGTAAWIILLPGCVLSLAWAVVLARRDGAGDVRELAVPGAFTVLGVVLAILPALLRATVGPTTLFVFDSVGYIPIDQWMRDTHEGTVVTPFMERWNLVANKGYDASQHGVRVGVSGINASVSALFGTSPDQTHLAFMAVLFGLVPVSVWIVARAVGIGRTGASVGAVFGLSPSLYTMVGDSTLANLTASALVAPLLLTGGVAAVRGGFRACAITGILVGGLVSIYPEFLTPTIGVAGIAAVVFLTQGLRHQRLSRAQLWTLTSRFGFTAIGIVIVWWVPVRRAQLYLSQLTSSNQPAFAGLPRRWLSLEDVGAWAFGVLHLYQLPRFDLLSSPRQTLAIVLPILLGLLVIWGSSRLGLWRAILLLAPVGVSIPLALEAHDRYQGGHCEYCEWKALTYALPFLAIGVAAGAERMWHLFRERRGLRRWAAIAAGLVPLTGIAVLAYADERLGKAMYESSAILPTGLREVAARLDRAPAPRRVLIDAPDASYASPFILPASYYLLRQTPDTYISFDASGIAPAYLYPLYLPIPAYFSPSYQYVLTPFAGMATGRRVLEQRGNFALEERRKIDVTIARTGWTLDTHEGSDAIPWLQNPFRLWLASAKAQQVSLRIKLSRPLHDQATLSFATTSGRALRVLPSADGSSLCIPIRIAAGRSSITVSPQFDAAAAPAVRNTESDPLPSPPRAIGLAGLRADTRPCPPSWARNTLPALAYGSGWFPPESEPPNSTYRWMGTNATIEFGQPGFDHPAAVLRSTIWSLVIPRRVTITLDGRLITSFEALPGAPQPFAVHIPAGTGQGHLSFHTDPPAASASQVTPSDHRKLAVRIRVPEIRRS